MQKRKNKGNYLGKKRLTKLTSNKHMLSTPNYSLEIRIPKIQEDTIICNASVFKIGVKQQIKKKSARKASRYRIIGNGGDSEWKIQAGVYTVKSLTNSNILVTNGKKVTKGKIVKVYVRGGGATGPIKGGGLPPIDE